MKRLSSPRSSRLPRFIFLNLTSIRAALLVAALSSAVTGCGRNFDVNQSLDPDSKAELPSNPPSHEVDPSLPPATNTDPSPRDQGALTGTSRLVVNDATAMRYLVNGILETKVEIPLGTEILIPTDYQIQNLNYRKPDGTVDWSSTGFIAPVTIASVPASAAQNFPQATIDNLNQTPGGLYVFASVAGTLQGVTGEFAALSSAQASADYLKLYDANGKPKFSYNQLLVKRFGARLNAGVDPKTLTKAQRIKWNRIYEELKRAADRTVETPKSLLMIEKSLADQASIAFEQTGVIPPNGAWTIAVQSTAVRHGFPNVPCAEFMSEMIREAYQRAGYRLADDFNDAKKNRLIWSESAAVVNLSKNLNLAGWIPWDGAIYAPPVGAVLMNEAGTTPGHAYISAGDEGRFIVDNGSPQGRDLRKTSYKITNMMYRTGLFFLPPGVNPRKW